MIEKIGPDAGKCVEKYCQAKYAGKCAGFDDSGDKCIENESFEDYSSSEIKYTSENIICKECRQGYSLNSDGDSCIENLPYCKNSQNYSKEDQDNINVIKGYDNGAL